MISGLQSRLATYRPVSSLRNGRFTVDSANPLAIFDDATLRVLAQAHRLQRLSALNVVGQRPENLRHKSALILGVSEGTRGELGGAQIEIRAREFRVVAHSGARGDRFVPNYLGHHGALKVRWLVAL